MRQQIHKALGKILSPFRVKLYDSRSGLLLLNFRRAAKFHYYSAMFDKVKNLEGDVVECGVGKALSFTMFAFLFKLTNRKGTLYGFDSFEGFPPPTVEDTSHREAKAGDSWAQIPGPEAMMQSLRNTGVKDLVTQNRIKLVKGFFDHTLPGSITKIALLHIDADLYSSYKVCLERLYPLLVKGGVVLFDEYNTISSEGEKWPGATKAINEYFGSQASQIQKDPYSEKYFLVKGA